VELQIAGPNPFSTLIVRSPEVLGQVQEVLIVVDWNDMDGFFSRGMPRVRQVF
jgi:hypothetical protein